MSGHLTNSETTYEKQIEDETSRLVCRYGILELEWEYLVGLAAAVFVCLFIQDMGFPCYGSIYRHAAACIGSYTVFLKFKNCISQLLQDTAV